jgi:hypothetical protein
VCGAELSRLLDATSSLSTRPDIAQPGESGSLLGTLVDARLDRQRARPAHLDAVSTALAARAG